MKRHSHILILAAVIAATSVSLSTAGPIHDAVTRGDVAAVTQLLNRDTTLLKSRDPSQETPLHVAARSGQQAIAELLVRRGADVRSTNSHRETPLHIATYKGYLPIVNLLIAMKGDVNAADRQGDTPLHNAALSGKEDIARILLEAGADVDQSNRVGRSPLHVAAQSNRVAMARLLIDFGAIVDARADNGNTPLHFAASFGHGPMVNLLMDHQADNYALNDQDQPPLALAICENRVESMAILLPQSSLHLVSFPDSMRTTSRRNRAPAEDLDLPPLLDEMPPVITFPFHYAVYCGAQDVVRYMIDRGVDVNIRTANFITPVMIAVEEREREILEMLLTAGADPSIGYPGGAEPLHRAAISCDTVMIGLLLDHGANIDANDGEGRGEAIHFAVFNHHPGVIPFLVGRGAWVDARGRGGMTPLHLAAFYDVASVETLLSLRPDVNAECSHDSLPGVTRLTPLHLAAFNGNFRSVTMLLDAGARIDSRASDGSTPLELALQRNEMGVATLLRQRSGTE